MLLTLVAWVYISFLCYSWGLMLIALINKLARKPASPVYEFCITCFIGLAFIGTILQCVSLIFPLGGMFIHAMFVLPALYHFIFLKQLTSNRNRILNFYKNLQPGIIFLLSITLIMVIVMGSYSITHPDTLAYHSQLIKWAERYRAIPGLVHLNYLYGLQNSWFLLCAFFSFSFAGIHTLTFINTSVLAWLLVFICQQINSALKNQGGYRALLWLSLLVINIWGYTQLRLTATSASPDFVATLYLLLIGYLMIKYGASNEKSILIMFFCFFAITLKLSAIPIVLLAVYLLYPFNINKAIGFLLSISCTMLPYMTRNAIISGHLFFPARFPDIVHADWKYDSNKLDQISRYVLSYARTHNNNKPVEDVLGAPFSHWIPKWWSTLYFADQLLIAGQLVILLIVIVNFKAIVRETHSKGIMVGISIVGIIFWFLKAPDPRFGMGFLLLFPALILSSETVTRKLGKYIKSLKLIIGLTLLLGIALFAYTAYRFTNYFNSSEMLTPQGIVERSKTVYYNEVQSYIPLIDSPYKNRSIVPADTLINFNFRGKDIRQGFRGKK